MHSLTSSDLNPDLLNKKPILLLNSSLIPIRSLIRYITARAFPGTAGKVPIEIWLRIIDYMQIKDAIHEAVRPTSIASSKGGTLLHCQVVDLDIGTFADRVKVEAAERWLPFPRAYDEDSEIDFTFAAKVVTNKTYAISFPQAPATSGSSIPALTIPDCLFTAITVPDVISRVENGDCWVCDGERHICPGCTGGRADKFDAFMGCGVLLACPLCMGIEFMQEDKEFCEKYYWEKAPLEEKAAREAGLRARRA